MTRRWLACATLLLACHAEAPTQPSAGFGGAAWPSPVPSPAPPSLAAPTTVTRVPVRVLTTRWRGTLPADESGAWDPRAASSLVDHLNAVSTELGLGFSLEANELLDVADESLSIIASTSAEAARAFSTYVASGRVSNRALTVVVVRPSSTWVSGWGNQDQPLGRPGSWPILAINTRIAKSRDAHWIGHELGHVLGLYDTTYYESVVRENAPYTRCGLSIPSRTFPQAGAPASAKESFMSYDVEQRRTFLGTGYAANRQIVACWLRAGT